LYCVKTAGEFDDRSCEGAIYKLTCSLCSIGRLLVNDVVYY